VQENIIPKPKIAPKVKTMPPIDLPAGVTKFTQGKAHTVNRIPTGEQQRWARRMLRERGVMVEWVTER